MRRESSFLSTVGLCLCICACFVVCFFVLVLFFTTFKAPWYVDLETQTLMWIECSINNVAEKGGSKKRYCWRQGGRTWSLFPTGSTPVVYDHLYISTFKRGFRTALYGDTDIRSG